MRLQIIAATAACLPCCAPSPGPIERQMVGLLEKFDRWDYNGDGYLVESELKPVRQLSSFTEKEVMNFYDKTGDGRISRTEALHGLDRVDEAQVVVEKLEAGE